MNRRKVLTAGFTAVIGTLGGCADLSAEEDSYEGVRLVSVDVLNRRESEKEYRLTVNGDGKTLLDVESTIGPTKEYEPKAIAFDEGWPGGYSEYKFSFTVEGNESLEASARRLGVRRQNVDCFRAVLVINTENRITGHAEGDGCAQEPTEETLQSK